MNGKFMPFSTANNAVMALSMVKNGLMSSAIPSTFDMDCERNPFEFDVVSDCSSVLSHYMLKDEQSKADGYKEMDEIRLKELESIIDQTTKRNAQILKSIKNKGYYAEYPGELKNVIIYEFEKANLSDQLNTAIMPMVCFIFYAANGDTAFNNVQFPFLEQEWNFAIEAGFYLWNPEVFCKGDVTDFRMNLKFAIPYIWWSLMFIHALNDVPKLENITQCTKAFVDLREENRKLKETVSSMERMIESNRTKAERKKAEAIERARKDAQREALSQLSKDIARLEHDIKDRDMRIADLTRQLSELSSQRAPVIAPKNIQQEMPSTESSVEKAEQADDSPEISLPSKGVLFVCGLGPLVKKVKSRHPDWTFASTKAIDTVDPSIQLVIIHTEFIGHDLENKVKSKCPDGVMELPVSTTNVDLMEKELLDRYRKKLAA